MISTLTAAIKYLLTIAVMASFSVFSYAGTLGDFEEDLSEEKTASVPASAAKRATPAIPGSPGKRATPATPAKSASSNNHGHNDTHYHDDSSNDCDSFSCLIMKVAFYGLASGGKQSMHKAGLMNKAEDSYISIREPGELMLPVVRLESTLHQVDSNISATNVNLEVGAGALAFRWDQTLFNETNPYFRLRTRYMLGLYRVTVVDQFGFDIGIGKIQMTGNTENTGGSFNLGFNINIKDQFMMSYTPIWSNVNGKSVRDYDFNLRIPYELTALKLGYRSLSSPQYNLDGPYAGLVFTW